VLAAIIQANSAVRSGPFVKVNVGALPKDLMEAELFGAEAGAFTGATKSRQGRFEAADGGTLFLDEIGNLSLEGQAKLLRVLADRRVRAPRQQHDASCEGARDQRHQLRSARAIVAGRFREDLYYRLNVIELKVPPLAERKEDILPLAQHFLDRWSEVRACRAACAARARLAGQRARADEYDSTCFAAVDGGRDLARRPRAGHGSSEP
jgi:DNA-binding NtrC family response regulator